MDIQTREDVEEELNDVICLWSQYYNLRIDYDKRADLAEDIIDKLRPIIIEIHKLILIDESE
jgi:hypothetical protein